VRCQPRPNIFRPPTLARYRPRRIRRWLCAVGDVVATPSFNLPQTFVNRSGSSRDQVRTRPNPLGVKPGRHMGIPWDHLTPRPGFHGTSTDEAASWPLLKSRIADRRPGSRRSSIDDRAVAGSMRMSGLRWQLVRSCVGGVVDGGATRGDVFTAVNRDAIRGPVGRSGDLARTFGGATGTTTHEYATG